MGGARIATIGGVDVRIDASWLLIALLVAWSFWIRFGPLQGYPAAPAIVMAAAAALLFFGSVLVHELAHALEAGHRGVDVGSITLFLFGGVTETRTEPERPRDELALSAVGPYSSLVAAAGLGLATTLSQRLGAEMVADVTGPLAWINLALALFNLLPGAPLDGGRILRSVVWGATGDRLRATRVAARAGQGVGGLIAVAGLAQILLAEGGAVGGLWLAFIGWFLWRAAGQELEQADHDQQLLRRTVGELAQPVWRGVEPETPAEVVLQGLRRARAEVTAVISEGRAVGVLEVGAVSRLGRQERSRRSASDLMRPLDQLPTAPADSTAAEVMDRLRREEVLVVTRDGEPVGLMTPRQLDAGTGGRRRRGG